jgi:hypothetical protein
MNGEVDTSCPMVPVVTPDIHNATSVVASTLDVSPWVRQAESISTVP